MSAAVTDAIAAGLVFITGLALIIATIRRDAAETKANRDAARWRKHERELRKLR